jgi:hypothetical protein
MEYDGRTNWNMVVLAAWIFFTGRKLQILVSLLLNDIAATVD